MGTYTVCPSLSLDNGNVIYSQANRDVGSVATHICNSGFQLLPAQSGETRTCTTSGWSGLENFTCGIS